MKAYDLTALAAALPHGTPVCCPGAKLFIGGLPIGSDFDAITVPPQEYDNDASLIDVAEWPESVTSAEEALAYRYFHDVWLERSRIVGDRGHVDAAKMSPDNLPVWTPGMGF